MPETGADRLPLVEPTTALRAGAASATLRAPIPLEGFDRVHDPLHVRALVLMTASATVVIVVIDFTSLPLAAVRSLKAAVASRLEIAPADVVLCVTHTFSAPHLTDHDDVSSGEGVTAVALRDEVHRATIEATSHAMEDARPATLGTGDGVSHTGASRDVPTPHGWWLGVNEFGPTDHAVRVLRVDDRDTGSPIAVLFTHATPPAVMSDSHGASGGRAVTADLAGVACSTVEQRWPGSVALALLGCAGDQTPVYTAARPQLDEHGRPYRTDIGDDGFELVSLLGAQLGAAVVAAADPVAAKLVAAPLVLHRFTVSLPAKQPTPFAGLRPDPSLSYVADGTRETPIVVLQVGDFALVGVQPELASATGLQIISASPFPHTYVATMVDGASKYLVDASGYERRTYSAMNAMYAEGAAEQLVGYVTGMLSELSRPGG